MVSIITRSKRREKFPIFDRDFFPNRSGLFAAGAPRVAR
jgi:hypothetical protein